MNDRPTVAPRVFVDGRDCPFAVFRFRYCSKSEYSLYAIVHGTDAEPLQKRCSQCYSSLGRLHLLLSQIVLSSRCPLKKRINCSGNIRYFLSCLCAHTMLKNDHRLVLRSPRERSIQRRIICNKPSSMNGTSSKNVPSSVKETKS